MYTGGTFDLFHAGHVNLLRACRNLSGDSGKVVVALNSDEFINEYKGSPPICSYHERKAVLESCVFVDEVVLNVGGADSKPAIDLVRPDYIAIGSDWQDRDYCAQMGFTNEWLLGRKIELIYVPYTIGISSTAIKNRII